MIAKIILCRHTFYKFKYDHKGHGRSNKALAAQFVLSYLFTNRF